MANKYYKKGIRRGAARIVGQKKYQSLIRKNKDKRILVFLHLFYPESWKEIREYLRNFEGYNWDLCITYPDFLDEKEGFQEIREDIRRLNPGTEFFCFENRGFDIGPFLTALRQRGTDGYDVVFKLQSKGTKRPWIYIYRQLFIGRDWFRNLFEGVVGATPGRPFHGPSSTPEPTPRPSHSEDAPSPARARSSRTAQSPR